MPALCSYFSECSRRQRGAVDLIERVRAHDEVAFRKLVERYQSDIFAFTRAVTGDENEADALAQKIFVRAYRDSSPRDTSMAITTWMYRLTFEECVLQGRIKGLKRTLQALRAAFVPRTAKSTETTRCVQIGGNSTIREGLQALSVGARVLLLLREFAHQSVSELAQITGYDVNVIREQLLRARRDLSTALRQMESRRV
jgi:RNA polymerase sigma factor (sigma-70 family)